MSATESPQGAPPGPDAALDAGAAGVDSTGAMSAVSDVDPTDAASAEAEATTDATATDAPGVDSTEADSPAAASVEAESEPGATDTAPAGEPQADAVQADEALPGFEFNLDAFRGPLDLLLHLIERRELDITEVSLLEVTEQYMEYVRRGEGIDLNALSEFISVGARLLLLKSRALLPLPPDLDPDDEDGGPEALIEALKEYRRFKIAAEQLEALDREARSGYRRDAAPPPVPLPTGLEGVDMEGLFAVLRDILSKVPKEETPDRPLRVPRPQVSLRQRLRSVVGRLEQDPVLSFRSLIGEATDRLAVIVDFLAVLELMKAGYLEARQSAAFGDIELVRRPNVEPPSFARIAEDYDGI